MPADNAQPAGFQHQHILTLSPSNSTSKNGVARVGSGKEKRSYQCRHCATTFRRSEHCVRHERSHTLEKPYGCRICHCHFSRKDLVVRHERTVHSDQNIEPHPAKRRKDSVSSAKGSEVDLFGPASTKQEETSPTPGMEGMFRRESLVSLSENAATPLTPPCSDSSEHVSRHGRIAAHPEPAGQAQMEFDVIDPDLDVLSFLPAEDTGMGVGATPNYEDIFNSHVEEMNMITGAGTVVESPGSMSSLLGEVFTEQPPTVHRERRESTAAEVSADLEAARTRLLQSLGTSLPPDLLAGFRLPPGTTLQRYIESYFNRPHRHIPILHPPTFSLGTERPCLVLAVCCIGAQYCLEKRRARYLYEWTKRFLAVEEVRWRRAGVPEKGWLVGSRLLLGFFAIFSSEKELVVEAISEVGWFAAYFRAAQAEVIGQDILDDHHNSEQTVEKWVQTEGLKRLCYGIYLLQSLISITFNLAPAIESAGIQLPLPHSEATWELTSPPSPLSLPLQPRFNDALTTLFGPSNPNTPPLPNKPSAFGAILLIHGLLCSQWHIAHYHASVRLLHSYTPPHAPPSKTGLLGKLQQCITYTHKDNTGETESALWFNAAGLLRQAYIRQFATPRMILQPETGTVDVLAMTTYVLSGIVRSMEVTVAAEKAMECLQMPIRAGTIVVRKTAALSWSVEHALAGMDCILFLLRWMHTLEGERACVPWDVEETAVYEMVGTLLEEADIELPRGGGPLTPALAALWGDLLADTWVWGITAEIGSFMQVLSERLRKPHVCF
ncbi:hypothetical protein EDC01DRAFT_432804 [Geopyxis carbonaria]|nr:hypothetical protein EDC01DRAFT_432804 [Geopyxis carbonaria]